MMQIVEAFAQGIDCNTARIITVSMVPTIIIAVITTLMVEYWMQDKSVSAAARKKAEKFAEDTFQKSHRDYMKKLMDGMVDELTRSINYNTLLEAIEYLEGHPNQGDLVFCADILEDPLQSNAARENVFRWLLGAKLLWKHDATAVMFPWFAIRTIQYGAPYRGRSFSV